MVKSHRIQWEPILRHYLRKVKGDPRGATVFIEYGSFNPDVINSDKIEFVDNKFEIETKMPERVPAYHSLDNINQIINSVKTVERWGRTVFRITFLSDDEPRVNNVYERGTIPRTLGFGKVNTLNSDIKYLCSI